MKQQKKRPYPDKQLAQSMEDYLAALKSAAATREYYQQIASDAHDLLSGKHSWVATSHARPTYCNVCREALSGVTSHGYSCVVCKCKVHKRCSTKAISNCKWTTLASIGKDIIEDKDGNISMPHQWMEGNLPVSAKCAVCEKTCGSVLRLQDWRCLWCKATVHTACRPGMLEVCPLGPSRVSVVPPTALHSIGSDEAWEAIRPQDCSPLLVFVNSKSGDNQGVKFLRRFKQLLNPAQVFDLISTGPGLGLRLFRHFDPFRILVCSGDGSVGWVLSEIDRLNMQKQCQVGVLPLGTGNDLARVLGWGSSCDDDTHIPQLLDRYEKASTKILDRWSIMTFERSISMGSSTKLTLSGGVTEETVTSMAAYEDSVVAHLAKILQSDDHSDIIASAKVLCETVKDFSLRAADLSLGQGDREFSEKCQVLRHKLDLLLESLRDQEQSLKSPENQNEPPEKEDVNQDEEEKPVKLEEEKDSEENEEKEDDEDEIPVKLERKEQLVRRADSLKRAVRQLVEHTEKMVDDQNKQPNQNQNQAAGPKMDTLKVLESPSGDQMPGFSRLPSPLPDLRRDSACDEFTLVSLPVPTEFADTRRNSSTDGSSGTQEGDERRHSLTRQISVDLAVDVRTSVEAAEDNVPDPTKCFKRITTPEMSLDNDEGETIELCVTEADDEEKLKDGILSGFKMSEDIANIGHIDSSETSDDSPEVPMTTHKETERKRSLSEDRAFAKTRRYTRLPVCDRREEDLVENDATNLISTSPEDDEDDDGFSDELGIRPKETKRASIAHFVEGFDIGRRSIKCRHRNVDANLDPESEPVTDSKFPGLPIIQIDNPDDEKPDEVQRSISDIVKVQINGSSSNLCSNADSPVTYLGDNLDVEHRKSLAPSETDDEELARFHEMTKGGLPKFGEGPMVVIDPPSPPTITLEVPEEEGDYMRRPSFEFCRKLSAASPSCSLLQCSPATSRRISSASLLRSDSADQPTPSSESSKPVAREKRLPIINPLVRLPMWPNVSGGAGLISQALLANADALCAAAVPLMDPDETLMEGFFERCVMNNYFGIGIDAKISLDFHHKREEHPEKCRSRARNYMWYGVLGSKEWLQKTYKNLEQRVQLECDGQRIPLPSLQGIVILNIPSFMGGTNFWGGTKEDDVFLAPSVDDKILEVVAVFGSVQMAASRLINLQHHRIAQCQTVQINILGDEGVPIQVDGEAWIQPPGMIRIIHKNRMKMLCRNRSLEESLRTWQKQRQQQLQPRRNTIKELSFADDESHLLLAFVEALSSLIKFIKSLITRYPSVKPDIEELLVKCSENLEKVYQDGKLVNGVELRPLVTELVSSARELHEETCILLRDKGQDLREDLANQLNLMLTGMEAEFQHCRVTTSQDSSHSYVCFQQPTADDQEKKRSAGGKGLFWKLRREKSRGGASREVAGWGVAEVCTWLESLQLSEYAETFQANDIRGRELLTLTRRDLKDLGVTKVGHVKRILQAIKELNM
ncbi:diacylglycerol kinase eta-like isoform X1 [Macrosteles quadrilineatus]|uniref:diacylglycerol kinase eta-like isoform X1 n=2 Tax=Macrosteles quadrilineatus TaxID=74068 RepID=UPI0023E21DB3|nr:diacylglycerol kinase eta-like isoform X1 [Macrosteles quadrilineatus]